MTGVNLEIEDVANCEVGESGSKGGAIRFRDRHTGPVLQCGGKMPFYKDCRTMIIPRIMHSKIPYTPNEHPVHPLQKCCFS